MTGSLSLSWGTNGGFYAIRRKITKKGWVWRVCVWRVALTYVPIEIDRLLEAYADQLEAADQMVQQ